MTKTEIIREFVDLLDAGILIRNTRDDNDKTAFIRQGLRIVLVCSAANKVLTEGDKRHAERVEPSA